jgi:hypothetical protein
VIQQPPRTGDHYGLSASTALRKVVEDTPIVVPKVTIELPVVETSKINPARGEVVSLLVIQKGSIIETELDAAQKAAKLKSSDQQLAQGTGCFSIGSGGSAS